MKYSGHRSSNSSMMIEPMTGVDFQQAAGRAGRLGTKQTFGRAIITAETPYEQEILWDKYVYSSSEDPISAFSETDLPDLILRLLACGVATKPDEIDKSCETLYGAFDTNLANNLSNKVNEALVFLDSGVLVAIRNGGRIETTSLGQACCATALSANSVINIRDLALKDKINGLYEWLLVALGLKEWMENSSGYYCPGSASAILSARLSGVISEYELDFSNPIISAIRNVDNPANKNKLMAFLFAIDWCAGTPTTNMEKVYNKGAGGLKKDARTLSWIISAIDKINGILLPPSPDEKLTNSNPRILADKLHYGVDERMLPLASALDIDREFIRRLYESGIISCEHLIEADSGLLSSLVPKSAISKIEKWRKNRLEEKCNLPNINVAEVPLGPRNNTEPQILFTGCNQKQKCEVKIGEQSIFLPPRLYSYFQKLWWAYKSQNPLVHKDSLDAGPNQAKYISKLRKLLRGTGIDIISNGRGSYQIIIHDNC
jgi:replicative superfamily II helicase